MMKKNKKLSHTELLKADSDSLEAASVANLRYVNQDDAGIVRIKKGKSFIYRIGNKLLKDKQQLERIRKLAIPPSWKDVWICSSPQGHIQATGIDLRNRKQYRYHAGWHELRNETKFHRLYEFGKMLPQLRKKLKKDIAAKELSREKVLATAIDLMDKTYIRVGNNGYEKMNGSYGLTTLKDKHVSINNGKIIFSFTGKKGIDHTIRLKDRKLASIIKQCRDIPGRTLFQYYDEEGNQKQIDSGMVNQYIKDATRGEFSAKDFRTWAGSLQAIEYFRSEKDIEEIEGSKRVAAMLDSVCEKLGNSRSICRKYYVHPQLIALCEDNKLSTDLFKIAKKGNGLSESEYVLMNILKKGTK
jgi:DNA topoisomerase-1